MKKIFPITMVLVMVCSVLAPAQVFAINKNWDCTNPPAVDANLGTASNWTDDISPLSGDVLYFDQAGAYTTPLNDLADPVGGIVFNGSTDNSYNIGGSTLTLSGDIDNTSAFSQTIGCVLSLDGAAHDFDATATLTLCRITGLGGFTKSGVGHANLTVAGNDYEGLTDVTAGSLLLYENGALGQTAQGTIVRSGTTLGMFIGITSADPLTLNGNGDVAAGYNGALYTEGASSWTGAITLGSSATIYANNGTLALSGGITGGGNDLTIAGGGDTTISGAIATGAGGLIKQDGSTLTLSGANTYTGATTINVGTLKLGASEVISTSSAVLMNGGTLDLNGFSETIGSLSGTSNVINTPGTLATLTTGGDGSTTSYSGVISGAATYLVKEGAGTFTLFGANTYSGNTTITGGILKLGAAGVIPDFSGVEMNGGILDLNGFNETIGYLAGTSNVTSSAADSITLATGAGGNDSVYSGVIEDGSGVVSLVKESPFVGLGTLTLSGNNTYTGTTAITGGTLKLGAAGVIPDSSAVTVNGGILDLNGFSETIGSLSGTSNVTGNGVLITGGDDSSTSYSGVIETGSLTKVGAGTFGISGANTYTGATTISGGTLQIDASGVIPDLSAVVMDGGLLNVSGHDETIGSLSGTSNITNGGPHAILTTGGDGTSTSYSGVIETGSLVKEGVGTFTISGANTYIGSTTINAGTLKLGAAGAISDSSAVVMNGGTLDLNGFSETIASLSGTSNVINGGVLTTGGGNTSTSYSGAITSGSLTKEGIGTFTISGANTYTGATTITGGTLKLGAAGVISDSSAVVMNGGILDLNGASETIGSLSGTSNVTSSVAGLITLATGGDGTFTSYSGVIENGGSTVSLTKEGVGTFTISGANTYTGTTTINAGTLKLGAAGVISDSSAVVMNGGILDLNGASETIGSLSGTSNVTSSAAGLITLATGGDGTSTSYSGVIGNGAGTVSLTKEGVGTFTISGANTYTGTTTISNGTLALSGVSNNTIANSATVKVSGGAILDTTGLAGSNLILASGQTLKGLGTVFSDLTVDNGSKISPGDSPGTINDIGNVTYAAGGTYVWEINKANGTQGTDPGWDLQSITGSLNITAAAGSEFIIDITGLNLANVSGVVDAFNKYSNYIWTIASSDTSIIGFDSSAFTLATANFINNNSISGLTTDGFFGITTSGNNLRLTYTAAMDVSTFYWKGDQNAVWNTNAAGNTNWATTSGGGIDPGSLPGAASDVYFTVNSGAANFTTTLGQDFSIKSLTFTGTGTSAASNSVTIGGANTLTVGAGGITVESGSAAHVISTNVALGAAESWTNNGSNLLTVSGNVSNAANTLTLDGAGDISISGVIGNGAGGLTKSGAGTSTISGTNTYTGATAINNGTLTIANSSALGTGSVTNSATLDVGAYDLNIGGNYLQQAGSTLGVSVSSASAAGKVSYTGAGTTINATSTVAVTVPTAIYVPTGATFTVIDGIGGTINIPDNITSSSSRVGFTGESSLGRLILTASRAAAGFAGLSSNPNIIAVGGVLDNVTSPTSDMTTVLNTLEGLSDAQAITAMNSMLAEYSGANIQISQHTLDQLTNAILGHQEYIRNLVTGVSTGSDTTESVDVWAQGYGSYLHQDPRQFSRGYNATIWGTAVGIDAPAVSDLRAGTCFGFAQDYVRGKDNSNRTNIDSYQWTVYGEYAKDDYYIDLSGAFALNTYDASRKVAVGAINRTASADYNGQQYQVYAEGGYTLKHKNINITPLASFQYQHLYLQKYTETGANSMNLSVKSQNYDLAQTGFGLKLEYPLDTKCGRFVPELKVKWFYDWVGDAQAITSTFAGGGGSFATNGFTPAQSSWDFGTKLTMFTKNNWTLAANYDFELKEDFYGHYGYVNAKYSF